MCTVIIANWVIQPLTNVYFLFYPCHISDIYFMIFVIKILCGSHQRIKVFPLNIINIVASVHVLLNSFLCFIDCNRVSQ